MPSIVFESGFSESFKELKDDLDLWIKGGVSTVKFKLVKAEGEEDQRGRTLLQK
jgi:hypothetical protein